MNAIETQKKEKKNSKSKSTKTKVEEIQKIDEVEEIEQNNIQENDQNNIQENNTKDETDQVNTYQTEESSISNEEHLSINKKIIELLLTISKISLKNRDTTKDYVNQDIKDIAKMTKILNSHSNDRLEHFGKEYASSLKNKDSKGKKIKKTTIKENSAINKQIPAYKEVLDFMKLPEDTTISRAQILQSINSFIKTEKDNENPDIFVTDIFVNENDNTEDKKVNNKKFHLIGDLKILFSFIKSKMEERNELTDDNNFETSLSYTQIMKYLKFCFPLNK